MTRAYAGAPGAEVDETGGVDLHIRELRRLEARLQARSQEAADLLWAASGACTEALQRADERERSVRRAAAQTAEDARAARRAQTQSTSRVSATRARATLAQWPSVAATGGWTDPRWGAQQGPAAARRRRPDRDAGGRRRARRPRRDGAVRRGRARPGHRPYARRPRPGAGGRRHRAAADDRRRATGQDPLSHPRSRRARRDAQRLQPVRPQPGRARKCERHVARARGVRPRAHDARDGDLRHLPARHLPHAGGVPRRRPVRRCRLRAAGPARRAARDRAAAAGTHLGARRPGGGPRESCC